MMMRTTFATVLVLAALTTAARADDPARFQTMYGFIDETGAVKVKLDSTTFRGGWSEGFLCYQDGNGDWRYVDANGKKVGKLGFDFCEEFSEGLAAVRHASKGDVFIDTKGKIVLTPKWKKQKAEAIKSFHDGLAPVRIGAKWGFIDKTGKWVVEPTYGPDIDYKKYLKQLAKLARSNDEDAAIEYQGSVDFDAAREFSQGRAPVRVGDKWGYIDTTGAMVIEPTWTSLAFQRYGFKEDLAIVSVEAGGYAYIDRAGKVVIPGPFTDAFRMSEGLAAVKDADGWRYVDKTGKTAFKLGNVESPGSFFQGLAGVLVAKHKFGYIDKNGAWVITPQLWGGTGVSHGVVLVNAPDWKTALLDVTGKAIWVEPGATAAWEHFDPKAVVD